MLQEDKIQKCAFGARKNGGGQQPIQVFWEKTTSRLERGRRCERWRSIASIYKSQMLDVLSLMEEIVGAWLGPHIIEPGLRLAASIGLFSTLESCKESLMLVESLSNLQSP
mmetsp:Transcript_3993/g.6345  ORF Transcript_3993/g.6345 Transcript_3993/m.6345 type:complete len:111 (-) Transcript_3993:192-524(-)